MTIALCSFNSEYEPKLSKGVLLQCHTARLICHRQLFRPYLIRTKQLSVALPSFVRMIGGGDHWLPINRASCPPSLAYTISVAGWFGVISSDYNRPEPKHHGCFISQHVLQAKVSYLLFS